MRSISQLLVAGMISLLATPASADTPVVLASIKPVHSLVSSVMQGVAEPGLIVEGAASPHSYALKPSQAKKLAEATHVFWVGHELEAFLEKPIETVAAGARAVELLDVPGLITLKFREGSNFEAHDHEDEHHGEEHNEEHEEHAEAHEGHGHEENEHDKLGHEEHEQEGHHHDGLDPHVWLDPQNAIILVREIATILSNDDPTNADRYAANAARTIADLDALTDEILAQLAPVREERFVVFHDAYHYFEGRFGLHAAGSITISPEITPGAERVREIQHRVRELGAACIFAEPQFEPRLIAVVREGSDAKSGALDPLGANLEDGPALYFNLIRNMADSMRDCLS